ncbi:SNF2 family domain-containing protein [Diplocarpon rosae]|nr:SNF2 family domain-containing protein [Diplocarpon rosae]
MVSAKVIARGGRKRSIAAGSTSFSRIGTPRNGPDLHSSSETGPPRDLPHALIDFILEVPVTSEPPRKRQKIISPVGDPEHEHIVVKKSVWEVGFVGSKLSQFETSLQKKNILPYVHWNKRREPEYIEIKNQARTCLIHIPLPSNGSEDVHLALHVNRDTKKWASTEGRLWTQFDLALLQKDGLDLLQIVFTVKWNVTTSPYHAMQAAVQTKALYKVLNKYFPDPNVTKAEKWSPQDFYQSVHSPDKNDDATISMEIDGLTTDLYPFQKRAVQWLLRREGVNWSTQGIKPVAQATNPRLPISFIQHMDDSGRICYVSHLFGLVTLDPSPFLTSEKHLKGGILAEEMGLGKTVEIISLISLHRRPKNTPPQIFNQLTGQDVRSTGATLIIVPPSILSQWISEFNKHAPQLKVFDYQGIRAHDQHDFLDLLNELAGSDVVISTYSILAAEIHFTQLNPEKTLRRKSIYPRPKSPLMMLSWWRCIIDEAQMIESGVSNAAVVARMIPRVNAWCVTGTPVRKDVNDLLGLLVFLRYEPLASSKHVWASLISSHKDEFRKLFGALALRHSKQIVRDELKLPAQRRWVITMPFTPIEEQHYSELFSQMCDDLGVDTQGAPLTNDWDPDQSSEVMRRWLVRLRKTALHPEVGSRNRRALGQNDGSLRTVDQVLGVMMENTDISIRADQRALLTTKLKRGQLFENSPRVQEALAIWVEAAGEARSIVAECREQLKLEIAKGVAENDTSKRAKAMGEVSNSEDEQPETDPASFAGVFRMRLRNALEIEHMAIFFRTNAYFQIKSNKEVTQPDSGEFRELERLEAEGYEAARKLRQEILQESFGKSDSLMRKISRKAVTQNFVTLPGFSPNVPKGGVESRGIIEKLDLLAKALDAQADILDQWRGKTIQFLLRPLIDEEEGLELTGEEYEDSTKTQDEVQVYVNVLRFAHMDRQDALTGQENALVKSEIKYLRDALKDPEQYHVACPEKTKELLDLRQQVRPTKEMGSIRGIVSDLRGLSTSLRLDAAKGNQRAQNELSIVEEQLKNVQRQAQEQTKAAEALGKEVALFTRSMNARLEYYKQLQQISDQVAPYEGPNDDDTLAKFLQDEEKLRRKIATAKAKRRYLDHLREDAINPKDQRICVICRETFEIGALTVCGHQYCKDCIRQWWNSHRNCPVCKRPLSKDDMHQITYKPRELSIQAEEVHGVNQERSSSFDKKSAIYSEISKSTLAEIKNVQLDDPSFTTKVDTLARHLIWLRQSDPGAKSIIFSSFKEFLDVLAQAFTKFRIGYSSIDKPNGINKFKSDPGIECFLLHARAHSSGLNLVNANHVFLCEPLLNTALELQAIARVDRIGQQQETNVWLYLVNGTVEESIHQLSVTRRMEHIGQRLASGKGKEKEKDISAKDFLDSSLEEANSMELQQASLTGLLAKGGTGGEMIMKEDLWDCLFGGRKKMRAGSGTILDESAARLEAEVGRELRAEAAEERLVVAGVSG